MTEQEGVIKTKRHRGRAEDGGGLIWFLGVIGAAVYYFQHAATFGEGLLGLLKALAWPPSSPTTS